MDCTKTFLNIGDTLRLRINNYFKSDADITELTYYFDANSKIVYDVDIVSADGESSDSGTRTDLKIHIPFKIIE